MLRQSGEAGVTYGNADRLKSLQHVAQANRLSQFDEDRFNGGKILGDVVFLVSETRVKATAGEEASGEHPRGEQCTQRGRLFMIETQMEQCRVTGDFDRYSQSLTQTLPAVAHQATDAAGVSGNVHFAQLADRRHRSGGPNRFSPVRTGDERRLSGVHDATTADDRGHRMTVADRFCKHGNVRHYTVLQMRSAEMHAPAGRNLVEDQRRTAAIAKFADSV